MSEHTSLGRCVCRRYRELLQRITDEGSATVEVCDEIDQLLAETDDGDYDVGAAQDFLDHERRR